MHRVETVLVTGGAGHVGQAFRRFYGDPATTGYRLRLTDRTTRIPADPEQETVVAELTDYEAVLTAMQGCSAVVHLAADTWGSAPWVSLLPNNIDATYNVYEAARVCGVQRIVYASTHHTCGYALGESGTCGTDEANPAPIRPDSLYAVSKVFGEALGRYYVDAYGLSVICLRIGWCHGGDGEADQREMVARMKKPSPAFPYGGETQVGLWISNRDMAQLIDRSLRADVPYGIYYGASDNAPVVLDVSSAKRDLGYRPQDRVQDRM
ncbi:MAG: NAD(P)-dependent oxidoreductase [Anaerolineae bacterium]|nr:NAD(P)-dependent oxidoreductase [Anaerolineae bacterium]